MKSPVIVALVTVFLVAPAFAELESVSINDFRPATKIELFNAPTDYANAVDSPDKTRTGSLVLVGTNHPYAFASQVVLVSPIPNVYGDYLPQICVAKHDQDMGFGVYGNFVPNFSTIPGGDGAGYLIEFGSSFGQFPPFELKLPGEGAYRVGGYVMMAGQAPGTDAIIIQAWGPGDVYLGSISKPACQIEDWSNNFFGITSPEGMLICKIGVSTTSNYGAGHPAIAKMMFDPLLAGDVNKDSHVDVIDLLFLAESFGFMFGEEKYNPDCDFNKDDIVDVTDLLCFVENWGL